MTLPLTPEVLKDEIRHSFNIAEYLEARDKKDDFIMVEIGHGGVPVAYNQPEGFKGQRAYIGLESWMRGGKERGQEWINNLIARKAVADNIFYMSYDTGGVVRSEPRFDAPDLKTYIGPFNTTSLLPDETADEIFASNVFCDPQLAYYRDRTEKLLAEMNRMVTQKGTIILRETITPAFVTDIDKEMLDSLGLEVIAVETDQSSDLWNMLEQRYAGERFTHNLPGSYYLFLSKQTEA